MRFFHLTLTAAPMISLLCGISLKVNDESAGIVDTALCVESEDCGFESLQRNFF